MNAKIIGIAIASIVIVSVIITIVFVGPIDVSPPKKEEKDEFASWNRSGPFAINQFEYKLGESVFLSVNGLAPNDVGRAAFVLPNATKVYFSLPFDGSLKSAFNYYFKPSISKVNLICSTDQIIGEWVIVFDGTKYDPIRFKIINETIPGEEINYKRVC